MFTKAQIREIASKICWWGKKDSSLSAVSATADDTLVVVKDGENRNVTVSDYQEFIADGFDDGVQRRLRGQAVCPSGVTPHIFGFSGSGSDTTPHPEYYDVGLHVGFHVVFSAYAEGCARVYRTVLGCKEHSTSAANRTIIELNLYPTVTFFVKTQLPSGTHVELGPIDVYIDDVLVGRTDADMDEDGYERVVVSDVDPGSHTFMVFMQGASGEQSRTINGIFSVNGDTVVRVNILNSDENRDS